MSTTVEHVHELEPHIRIGRARAAVIMFIVSDALSVLAILAAGGYLKALNTENQFRIAGDHAPVLLPGLLVAIVLVLSGLFYFLWERRARENEGTGQRAFYMLALVCVVLALVGQIWVILSLGYTTPPFHSYESILILITWFTWVHFLLLLIIGILLLGRIMRGRLVGFGFIAEVTGYWWYYTVLSSLLLWVFSLLL
jgi:heme/copper-type cytochrome/quinol oxidase subunit 4